MAECDEILVAGRPGGDARAVADDLAAVDGVTAAAATAADPAGVEPDGADCLVWVGPATGDGLAALIERAGGPDGTPVVVVADGDLPPEAAFDAGVADFVRAGEGDGSVLARRVGRLLADEPDSSPADRTAADGSGEAADALRATPPEANAERVLERVDAAVMGIDDDWRITYLNGPAAEALGKPADAAVGEVVWEAFPDIEGSVFEREYRAALSSQAVRTFETRYEPEDSWLEVSVFPAADGLSVYVRDVTEQKRTKAELERNERALRDLQRLASSRDRSFDEKLERALAVGCERLDLPLGYMTRIDGDTQTVVAANGDAGVEPGTRQPVAESYCRRTVETDGLLALEHAAGEGWDDDPAYERHGMECYLGGKLLVDGELYGTLCFGADDAREAPFSDAEETFIELLIEWVSYELERREREQDLGRYETIVRSVDDGVYELDDEGRFTFVNPAMSRITGYDADELVGEHVSVVKDDDATAAAVDALLSGEATERTVESVVQRKRGPPVPCEDGLTALTGDEGAARGVVGVVRDVTEQKAHREMLSELVTSSRSLMQARDRGEVAEMAAQAVAEVLGFELNTVRLFDRETDRLEPAGTTGAVAERGVETPTYDVDEGGPGRAFVDGKMVVVEDTATLDDDHPHDIVRSALHIPMGVHGTISIGAETVDAFSNTDRQAAQLLATSAAAAANRAKREQEVREARERVDTLVDRINGLIENTVEVLVQAGTREELEAGVVEQLVATDPYAFAWIGRPDLAAERLEAAAWAGDVPELADAVADLSLDRSAARDAADPAALALDDEAIHIVDDLADAPDGSVHAAARDAGLGSLIAVPLTYKDASYGVLCVYAPEADAFADREQVVLDALGRAVANAVNAIESGRILSTDRVVELEFTVRDDDLLFNRLSGRTDATYELTGSVHESDGSVRLYVAASGADAEEIESTLAGDDGVAASSIIADHDGDVLFEAVVDDSLVESLADHGAVTRSVVAEDGLVRYTIELPYEAEARELFELVSDRYRGTDLVGYHEHERPVRTRQEFREAVTDRFTDRQETAIRTAYLGGFFEWPRDVDGDDLAGSMDISRPTYHQHLRAAQRKVFDELFDPHSGR
ncbi:bacterio-opsin activator domain-containing protein [Halosimplex pelagicum]|uniref:GAF domain-containing protein n=1 Tax=Halosimplex pelagicum TaxID=869886 RepID=A0A7D5PE80_9EURY|nr:bacterio-opsin activator domain-containing protein [Halosimplex pelagicum]QLH84862.1 GAF domain-containing protein [Halosimplex pelagicum]